MFGGAVFNFYFSACKRFGVLLILHSIHLRCGRYEVAVSTRTGVKRDFWPIIVRHLFCFSE